MARYFTNLPGSDSGAGSIARQFVRFRLAARDSIFVADNRITSDSTRAGSAALGERGQARFGIAVILGISVHTV